jgi:hypothetical protein
MDEHGKAWSGAWGVVAVVFGGGALGCWIAVATGSSERVRLLALAIGCSVIAVVALYCVFAPLLRWWPWRHLTDAQLKEQRRLTDAELKEQMRKLSTEIYEFLAERGEDAPEIGSNPERGLRHAGTTVSRYEIRFGGPALGLLQQAVSRGWAISDVQRHIFEHPTNPLGVKEVARTLGELGHRP